MSSSSPSSSSTPRNRKRTAKAMELDDVPEIRFPKIRIVNFDPSRRPPPEKINSSPPTTTLPENIPISEEQPTSPMDGIQALDCSDPTPPNLGQQTGASNQPKSSPPSEQSSPTDPHPPRDHSNPPSSAPPQVLIFHGEPIFPSDPLYPLLVCAKFCENCHTSETSYWRTDDQGRDHCNPCGLHFAKHHTARPIDPHHVPDSSSAKLTNLACQICPTRKHARRREEYKGVILCNACTDYWKRNNAVRPLIAFAKRPKGDRSREPGIARQTKKCANCGTGRATRWMPGPAGEDNCAECGLFWMYHNMRRPLGVGVGVDVIGPKRENRGPRIMDSRKRRLGSVNTGSGSETEEETEMKQKKMDKIIMETRSKAKDEKMDIDEPEDTTPISLLNLAILVRKVQLSLQELSFLDSPLIRRPAISALISVVDPIVKELAPLSKPALNSFTRSTVAQSVLTNLLAHVVAAEHESTTTEEERFEVVNDFYFGPEHVGDNFIQQVEEKEEIDAASFLLDLADSDGVDPFVEADYPGFKNCRNEIQEILDEYADDVDIEFTERPEVILIKIDNKASLYIDSARLPSQVRDEINEVAKYYSFDLIYSTDVLRIKPMSPKHPAAHAYSQYLPHLNRVLELLGLEDWGHILLDSNKGPLVIVGGVTDAKVKSEIRNMFRPSGIMVGFCPVEEMGDDGMLSKAIEEGLV